MVLKFTEKTSPHSCLIEMRQQTFIVGRMWMLHADKESWGRGRWEVCVDLMVLESSCPTHIPWSTGSFIIIMTWSMEQCVLHPELIQPREITVISEQLTLLILFSTYSFLIRCHAGLFLSDPPCIVALVSFMTCPVFLYAHLKLGWLGLYPHNQE